MIQGSFQELRHISVHYQYGFRNAEQNVYNLFPGFILSWEKKKKKGRRGLQTNVCFVFVAAGHDISPLHLCSRWSRSCCDCYGEPRTGQASLKIPLRTSRLKHFWSRCHRLHLCWHKQPPVFFTKSIFCFGKWCILEKNRCILGEIAE